MIDDLGGGFLLAASEGGPFRAHGIEVDRRMNNRATGDRSYGERDTTRRYGLDEAAGAQRGRHGGSGEGEHCVMRGCCGRGELQVGGWDDGGGSKSPSEDFLVW